MINAGRLTSDGMAVRLYTGLSSAGIVVGIVYFISVFGGLGSAFHSTYIVLICVSFRGVHQINTSWTVYLQ